MILYNYYIVYMAICNSNVIRSKVEKEFVFLSFFLPIREKHIILCCVCYTFFVSVRYTYIHSERTFPFDVDVIVRGNIYIL